MVDLISYLCNEIYLMSVSCDNICVSLLLSKALRLTSNQLNQYVDKPDVFIGDPFRMNGFFVNVMHFILMIIDV